MKIRSSSRIGWRCWAGLGIAVSVLLSACGKDASESKNKKSGDPVGPTAFPGFQSFLTPSMLMPPESLPEVTALELNNALGEIEVNAEQQSDTSDEPSDDCNSKKFMAAFVLTANKNAAHVDTTVDLSECLDPKSNLKSQVGRVYLYAYSDTCDMTGLDRKPVHGDETQSFFGTCPRLWTYNGLFYTSTDQQDKVTTWTLAYMDSSGLPCKHFQDATETQPTCSRVEISEQSSGLRYFRQDSTSLVSEPNSKYYSSGSIAFTYNDWRGTVTFLGPNTQPTWQAERAGEKASGKLAR